MDAKKIVLEVGEAELHFTVSLDDYNRFVNETMPADKISPSLRFLRRCVDPKDAAALKTFTDQGLTMDIVSALVEEFRPRLEIMAKK
ncbi:MAG: putative phage tail assembly chaperone [Victivallaceae bacterium]|nr:putative phage tail assembly chaperone [Victivallaceae bacterium]